MRASLRERDLGGRFETPLLQYAKRITGNNEKARDVVQETFVAILNSKFRGESAVRTWLVQILVRRAAMLRRSRKRATAAIDRSVTQGGSSTNVAERASGIAGTDARLDLSAMLQVLSPEHRQVILLREIEGMSYEAIAESLGVPRGTVESRLHRAREELRKRFKGYL